MSKSIFYCRFCAEEKPYSDLLAISVRKGKRSIIEKLSFLGIVFVDFSNKMLPETVCITCYELINVSYEFFLKVKRSQEVLSELCGVEVESEVSLRDEFASYAPVKEESADDGDYLQDVHSSSWEDHAVAHVFVKKDEHLDGDGCTTPQAVKEESDHEHAVTGREPRALHACTLCGDAPRERLTRHAHHAVEDLLPCNVEAPEVRTWAQYPALCRYCDMKMVDRVVLREHCAEAHRKCFGSQCVDCDLRVDCYQDFIRHVATHRPHLKNICPHCDMDTTRDALHASEHAANRHPCPLCGQLFPTKRALRAHAAALEPAPRPRRPRRRGPLTDQDLTCPVCGMIMKSPSTLKVHVGTQHTPRKRNYTCDRCGKAYYTKGSLVVHRKIHEGAAEETCKICHKAFLTVHRLRKHIKTHNLEMPFQCDRCKRFFSSKDRLREHVKVHGSAMPFQCQYCSKRFRHKSIARTHENQHTGARPYSCSVCCMQFANWSNCNKHMKRKHGATLAQHAMTPHGKLRLDPSTGRPLPLAIDQGARRWSEMMLTTRRSKNSNQSAARGDAPGATGADPALTEPFYKTIEQTVSTTI